MFSLKAFIDLQLIDAHSKREVFEILNMNEKNVNPSTCFLLKNPSQENGHVTFHVTYQHNSNTFHVKDDEFLMCAKFRSSSIFLTKLLPKIYLLNPLDPGFQPLE